MSFEHVAATADFYNGCKASMAFLQPATAQRTDEFLRGMFTDFGHQAALAVADAKAAPAPTLDCAHTPEAAASATVISALENGGITRS